MSQDPFANLFNTLKNHTLHAADSIDAHFDSLANNLRDKASDVSWIPSSVRPSRPPPPPPPPSTSLNALKVRVGSLQEGGIISWVQRHKLLTAGLVGATVGTVVYVLRKRKLERSKKRRAARSSNGARKEVVVIYGSPHDPVLKSLTLDLEKKGYIVYVIVSNAEDEQIILNEGRADIKPLHVDILDPASSQTSIDKFSHYLRHPIAAFPGAQPHHLRLASLILITDSSFPTGPVETIPLDHWSDTFNLKLLQTLAITQLFLPLLHDLKFRLLFITPSIPESLSLPFHAPEVAAVSALSGVVAALRRERGVEVVQIKTGTFDVTRTQHGVNAARADVLSWSPHVRAAYARNYTSQRNLGGVKGSSVRELHNTVFDAMTDVKVKDVVRVGSGSVAYDRIGRWAPEGLVKWMLGLSSRREVGSGLMVDEIGRGQLVPSSLGSRGSSDGHEEQSMEGSVEWERVDNL